MDQLEKVTLLALLAVGRRGEVLSRLQRTHDVSEGEAQKLLEALEAESPVGRLNFWELFRYAGFGIFLVGIILVGIGLAMYFSYTGNDERQMIGVTCTVTSINVFPGGPEVTFSFALDGRNYSITERHEKFRELGLVEGQELDILVNAYHPDDAVLPVLKAYVQEAGIRYGAMGAGLILTSILLWRFMRAYTRNR